MCGVWVHVKSRSTEDTKLQKRTHQGHPRLVNRSRTYKTARKHMSSRSPIACVCVCGGVFTTASNLALFCPQ